MRMHVPAVIAVGLAVACSQVEASIQILQSNGHPVPDGAATMSYNLITGGWDIALNALYNPSGDTVYNIRGNGGEIIDNIIINVEGPVAGSPVIVRVLSDAPLGVHSVRNIAQVANAEVLLNKVDVTHDIGAVQVLAIGQLFAGRDILGPVIATTPNNTARGITDAVADRHILGDLLAENGRIGLVLAMGNIGTPSDPVEIRARHRVMHISGSHVYAHINTRVNGGAGGMFALWADRFIGTLDIEQFLYSDAHQLEGQIIIREQFGGKITIGKSMATPGQLIELPPFGLAGQIVINADNVPGGAWTSPVRLGPQGDPQQIVLTGPTYTQPAALLGGGSVGLVPFKLHHQSCVPASGQTAIVAPTDPPLAVELRHYGPVLWKDVPVEITRRPIGSETALTPVPLDDFVIEALDDDPNTLRLRAAPARPGFAPGFQYHIRPAESLRCDVPSQPAVAWDGDYIVNVMLPPCDGDVDATGTVNVSDLLLVITYWGHTPAVFPAADIDEDGLVNVSDLLIVINNWGACW